VALALVLCAGEGESAPTGNGGGDGFAWKAVWETAAQARLFLARQLELKAFLENVYGLRVERINTLNYLGKKKKSKHGYYRSPDYKKAYVTLKPPEGGAAPAE
jgi:large subunit ribosomal protein L23